ncbi:MAG TPA: metal-sensing transcriptional repressor [Anaerolineales bacterium]|nr:metal-sensing transcriptional repressor [Anaerolineales bacterium]|tara:strand:+ start:715 stop:1521 length:807 start_codon:yes stop_codon:yes gene_type:complete
MKPKTLFPGTIWITGPSMSGKTTLGRHLQDALESRGIYNVELLDGPDVRNNLEGDHGYSAKERSVVVFEIAKLALECNNRGNVAIVCTISHVKEVRIAVRARLDRFFEVYLKCPLDVCLSRDYLGNYQKAYEGDYENFVDVTEPYQVSEHPDLLLDTANNSVEECTDILLSNTLAFLESRHLSGTKSKLQQRLRRIEGQVRGVQEMLNDGRECRDIVQQLVAIRSAAHSTALALVDAYALDSLQEVDPSIAAVCSSTLRDVLDLTKKL